MEEGGGMGGGGGEGWSELNTSDLYDRTLIDIIYLNFMYSPMAFSILLIQLH